MFFYFDVMISKIILKNQKNITFIYFQKKNNLKNIIRFQTPFLFNSDNK